MIANAGKRILDMVSILAGFGWFGIAVLTGFNFAACGRSALLPTDNAAAANAADAANAKTCRWLGFWPQVTYPAPRHPVWPVVADFDRDGHPDIAVDTEDSNDMTIYRNDGHGGFGQRTVYAGVTAPTGVAAADFNGDGYPDLAVASDATTTGTVAVFGNRGDGSFGSPRFYDIGAGGKRAGYVVAGDVNGDGHLDLVATSSAAGIIGVLLNTGGGTFSSATTIAMAYANQITLADLDGNGSLDLAITIAQGGGTTFTSLFNDGHGGFRTGASYGPGGSCCFIYLVAGDFRGKGMDAFASGTFGLSFYANDGRGQFTTSSQSVYGPNTLVTADFNRDGILDLAVATSTAIELRLSPGDGKFRDPDRTFAAGDSPKGMAAADFDGDGYPDLVVANADSDSLGVFLSRCEVDDGAVDAQ